MSRVFTCGFEFFQNQDNDILALGPNSEINSILPRRSAANNGGSRALEVNTLTTNLNTFQPLPYIQNESYIRLYFRMSIPSATNEFIFYNAVTDDEIFKVGLSSPTGPLRLNVNGVNVATGIANFTTDVYYSIKIYADIASSGSITVKVDGVADISYSGNTAAAGSGWNQLRLNAGGRLFYDDFAINDTYTRVNYKLGNGNIPSGTLSGSAPGSASIIRHVGDGTSGYMIIDKASGSFLDNDSVEDTASFTASVDGNEDTGSIGEIKEGFVQLLYPNDNGFHSQLTNSDDNSTDNYTYVNQQNNIATFVFDKVGGNKDTYSIQNMPSDAISVNHLDTCFLAQRDGNIVNNLKSIIRIGANDYESHNEQVPGSIRAVKFSYQQNPETKSDWLVSDVDQLESGPELNN